MMCTIFYQPQQLSYDVFFSADAVMTLAIFYKSNEKINKSGQWGIVRIS